MGISSLKEKLNIWNVYTTTLLVVFIVVSVLINASLGSGATPRRDRTLGGPTVTYASAQGAGSVVAHGSDTQDSGRLGDPYRTGEDSVVSANNPATTALESRDGTILHTIQEGENLSTIAAEYGVSLSTILAANATDDIIHPGDTLIVPPVSGVVHTLTGNESLDAVAALYGVSIDEILNVNDDISSGNIIIPGATKKLSLQTTTKQLPSYDSYYMQPTDGLNWGVAHYRNAVDFAESCGAPVFASAEGLVTDAFSTTGWNHGYGRMVSIEHPNETETLYAHLDSVSVSVGDFVAQGDVIGTIGNSGNTTRGHLTSSGNVGSGCHLHFEVHGANNPFVRS